PVSRWLDIPECFATTTSFPVLASTSADARCCLVGIGRFSGTGNFSLLCVYYAQGSVWSVIELSLAMAKSKNHTTHNQSRKWHRNGIKKPRSQRYESLKGVSAFLSTHLQLLTLTAGSLCLCVGA
uniref:60S ribosomal protein L29 n=1 Tax=Naja naja TaxID=35670 RepID=A0A8C6VCR3_NAJNA